MKTKNNQLVAKIERNDVLDEAEKERILQQHESRMHGIEDTLTQEKKKQEQELDRALKERLDRRHRMREKQHGKDIRKEEQQIEQQAADEYERMNKETKDQLAKEHDS